MILKAARPCKTFGILIIFYFYLHCCPLTIFFVVVCFTSNKMSLRGKSTLPRMTSLGCCTSSKNQWLNAIGLTFMGFFPEINWMLGRPQVDNLRQLASFSAGPNQVPVKKQLYELSSYDWVTLANHCHDLDPTNIARKNIIRGEDWIKEKRNVCRKYLHQTFIQYNPDMDEWCSQKEMERWIRATNFKNPGTSFFPT
jgi:hypothetical protein